MSPARPKSRRRRRGSSNRKIAGGSSRKGSSSRNRKSRRENKKFLTNFLNLVYQEKLLEEAKIRLSCCREFNLQQAYSMLDKKSMGQFGFDDFRRFIKEIGLDFIEARGVVELYSTLETDRG
jgi:hypothetical protein